jgi:hypothetical protein
MLGSRSNNNCRKLHIRGDADKKLIQQGDLQVRLVEFSIKPVEYR